MDVTNLIYLHKRRAGKQDIKSCFFVWVNMARDFSKAFYKSKEWQMVRENALRRDKYLCVKCGAPAEEVHHIEHLKPSNIYDPSVTLNMSNLACLCKACHFAEHYKDKARGHRKTETREIGAEYRFTEDGQISPL